MNYEPDGNANRPITLPWPLPQLNTSCVMCRAARIMPRYMHSTGASMFFVLMYPYVSVA